MPKESIRKNLRTLDLYLRLCEGKAINKEEEANRFGVDERSIQRDIDDIRAFLDDRAITDSGENRSIVYNRMKKGFVMQGGQASFMSNTEILSVSKVLLESRAFTKKEMNAILDKLIAGCVPEKNMKMVSDLLANEKYHYVELKHRKKLQDILWDFGEDIKKLRRVKITYEKINHEKSKTKPKRGETKNGKTYIVEPVGLLFSEYYFYLNAYIVEKSENGVWEHKYDYPAIFRLDRVKKREDTGEKFRVIYQNRFEEGEFRKKNQFMYGGKLLRIRFLFYGDDVESVLDRLPTAKIIKEEEKGTLIEVEVYGKGILMWILSQGKNIEVLSPKSIRDEMHNLLLEMLSYYKY